MAKTVCSGTAFNRKSAKNLSITACKRQKESKVGSGGAAYYGGGI